MAKLLHQKTPLQNVHTVFDNTLRIMELPLSATTRAQLHGLLQDASVASLSNAFKALRIDVLATRLGTPQLTEIPFPAIAHLTAHGGHFVVLTALTNGQLTYHDPARGWVKESTAAFATAWSGVTVLVEKNAASGDHNYAANYTAEKRGRWRIGTIGGLLAMWILTGLGAVTQWDQRLAGGLMVVGTALSGLLVAADFGSRVAHRFCQAGENFSCGNVLNSPAAKLFGWLKMSEVGWVWFCGGWLSWWLGSRGHELPAVLGGLALGSALAACYAPFSIGYQWLKIKQWCPLCLAVQAVLVGLALVLKPALSFLPAFFHNTAAQVCVLSGYGLSLLLWLVINPLLDKVHQAAFADEELRRFKQDPGLFSFLLRQQPNRNAPMPPRGIVLGPATAAITVTLVTNPWCEPCAQAHRMLEELTAQLGNELSVNVLMMTDTRRGDESSHHVARHVLSLELAQQPAALQAWYRMRDYATWTRRFPTLLVPAAEEALRQQQEWIRLVGITHTPAVFLGSRELPPHYRLRDLAFHLPLIKTVAP